MANQLHPRPEKETKIPPPKSVVAVKPVELILVSYIDQNGDAITQLALVGSERVQLLNNTDFGLGTARTSQGPANDWLIRGIFEKMGRKEKK